MEASDLIRTKPKSERKCNELGRGWNLDHPITTTTATLTTLTTLTTTLSVNKTGKYNIRVHSNIPIGNFGKWEITTTPAR